MPSRKASSFFSGVSIGAIVLLLVNCGLSIDRGVTPPESSIPNDGGETDAASDKSPLGGGADATSRTEIVEAFSMIRICNHRRHPQVVVVRS